MDSKARARLEKMMEYGEGMKPSARYIRVASNTSSSSCTISSSTSEKSNSEKNNNEAPPPNPSTLIVKDFIVERYHAPTISNSPRHDASKATNTNNDICSHNSQFAIQAAGCRPKDSPSKLNNRGFPSYYNCFPVGSLARRREPLKLPLSVKANSNTKALTSVVSSVSTPASASTYPAPPTTSKIQSSSADAIISNLSKVEIQEYIAQIHSSLSADKVAFLSQRGKEKNKLLYNASNGMETSNARFYESTDASLQDQSTHSALQQQKSAEQQQQQQQPGTIVKNTATETSSTTVNNPDRKDIEFYRELSSIQSPQDLDQIFQKYQSATIEEYKLKQILQNYGIKTPLGHINNNNNTTRNTNDFYYLTRIYNEDKSYVEGWQEQESEERSAEDEQELEYATNLLRSSSYKQKFIGSKIICDVLRDQVQKRANGNQIVKKWPIHLPVSLRCLLDENSSSSRKGKYQSIMMNAYVLESIYSLLLLFSPPEVTYASKSIPNSLPQNGGLIYHLYFKKDSVPTLGENAYPPLSLSALKPSVNLNEDSGSEPAMLYTTNSNFSAKSDGLSFYNDPLWTLLSRMQIIPCIGNLVKLCIDSRDATAIDEGVYQYYSRLSLVFICHILLMLSLRTPGAASAIVDNKNILPLLIKIALPLTAPSTPSGLTTSQSAAQETVDSLTLFDPQIALPFLNLIITLARQSRHVASCLSKSYINHLQATLAVSAETDLEWLVQKLCLVAWRIFLRYGLAISYSSILVKLGAFTVKWQNASEQSLLPEYLATYAELCHCTLVVKNSSASSSIIDLNCEEQQTIEKIGIWIAPTIKHIVAVLSTDYLWRGENVFLVSTPQHLSSIAEIFKTTASMLNLLSAYQNTTNFLHKISHGDTNLNSGFHPILSEEAALSVLQTVLNSGAIEKAVRTVLINTFDATVECDADNISGWLKLEASSCALIAAFLSLVDGLPNMILTDKHRQSDSAIRQYEKFCGQVKDILVDGCRLIEEHPQKGMLTTFQRLLSYNRLQRESWLNYANFTIVMFLCNLCHANSEVTQGFTTEKKDSMVQLLRPLTFCLLGRLRHGDEYVAFKLLQQNILFQPAIREGKEAQSQLPKMLMQQLFDNAKSCDQLAHSTNVYLPNDFPGRFVLASLRSDADHSVIRRVKHDQHEADEEALDDTSPLLPLGPLWLFHVLSSTCVVNHQNRTMTTSRCVEESSSILRSTLELLLYMEQQSISNCCEKWSLYTGIIHSGVKLYHLFNICFFPDGVLDSDVQDLFLRLFTIYNTVDEHGCDLVRDFMRACFNHLQRNQRHNNINPWAQKHDNNEQNKSLMDFATDLCTALDAYGAQYDVFVLCIRFLMRPDFPPDIIAHVILHVKDHWHLLTTTSEEEEEDCSNYQRRVICYVEDGLRGGIPSLDSSAADPSQILSAFCSVLKSYRGRRLWTAQHQNRYYRGVFYVVAVATIARNFALTGELSSTAAQKRYGELCQETAMHIWEVATKCLQGNGTKHDLSQIALDVCCSLVTS